MRPATATAEIGALYAAHGDWLRGWLNRYTRCSHKAADLAQDAFCRLLERSATPLPKAPRGYLATIARRLVIDAARRDRVEAAYLDAHRVANEGSLVPAPDHLLEAVEDLSRVAEALETLPGRTRRAYLLFRLEGWSHAEIAAELGVSRSMVKQYVAKGYASCYAAVHGSRSEQE
ncbi:MAG: sigma-70 family RNA polymerase sigma factor [Sphingobium sp.]